MTDPYGIRRRLRGVYVTPRGAASLALGAAVSLWLPGRWPWVFAAVWTSVWTLLVLSDVRAALGSAELEWSRSMPVKLSIGVPNAVRHALRNASARAATLAARETPPPGFEGERSFGSLELAPGEGREVTLWFTPPSRGLYRFGDVGVRSLGRLGLAGRTFTLPLAADARVYPDIQAVRSYALLARRGMLREIGVRAARYSGAGTEFESLADYGPDDDYRDIDWKATARRGSPVVRRYEAERSQTIVLAIDAGRLMTPRVAGLTKLDRAVNAALLLSYLATEAGDLVGLLVFGRDVRAYVPPRRGHRQFLAILEALYSVEGAVEEPDYARALRYLAGRLPKRSLVVLFTELAGTEPSERLLRVLGGLAPRHLPLVVTQRSRELESRALAEPHTETDVFAAAVAEGLLRDKATALGLLQSRGSLALDVFPEQLSVSAVNRYLEIKARGRL